MSTQTAPALALARRLAEDAKHSPALTVATLSNRPEVLAAEVQTLIDSNRPAIDGDTLRRAADRLDTLERAHAQTCATVAAFVLDYRAGPHALPLDRNAATAPLVDLLARIGAPDLHRFGIFPA